jgi:HK97 family phage major capsid protein
VDPEKHDDATITPIAALFNAVLEKREAKMLKGIERQITLLQETPADDDDSQSTRDAQSVSDRTEPPIVSRNQPTDSCYRELYRREPHMKDVRSPVLDHWNAMWFRAFVQNDLVTMRMCGIKASEAAGYRAITVEGDLSGTGVPDGLGGHLLPQPFADVVEVARGAVSVIAPLCENFTTTGATLRVPTVGAVAAGAVAEGSAPADDEGTIGSEMMILHKISAGMSASDEMVEDTAFNLVGMWGRRAGEGIGVAEDTQILTTNGTAPNLTEALAGGAVALIATPAVSYEDLNKIFFALGKAYQPNCTWLAGTVVAQALSNMMDGNDHPVLKVPNAPPVPITDSMPQALGTVLGRPIYHVPAVAGDLILGDLRGYAFLRKGGIVAKMSTDVGFASDTVHFKFTERVDGRLVDDVAIKELQGITGPG